jgi:hypothetical protein
MDTQHPQIWLILLIVWGACLAAAVICGWFLPLYHAHKRQHLNFDAIRALTILCPLCPLLWIFAMAWAFHGEYRGADSGGAFSVLMEHKQ